MVVVSGTLTVVAFSVVASVSASVVVVLVLFRVVGLDPGVEVFTLLLGFLVVVTSAKDLKGSNGDVLTTAELANAAL